MSKDSSSRPGAVVITGASTGMGRATSLALARSGYQVFAGVRRLADGEALVAADPSGRVRPVILDVTDQDSVAAAAEHVGALVGAAGLAGLVNNAGIGITGPIEALPVEDVRRLYEVNVFGQITVTQAFLPLLRRGTGRIVNIGSIGDRLSLPFGAALASSKWAFASITESLRLELRPWGIRVILVEPASIHTETVDKTEADAERVVAQMTQTDRTHYEQAYRTMIGRFLAGEREGSSPEVVAALIVRVFRTRRPRTRYLVGKDSRRLALLARWAPDTVFDAVRVRLFGLPRSFGAARAQDLPRVPVAAVPGGGERARP
jgi:NAD(P)-dependent dehydrogenase (short-subunit alcohol dehydrogenase family)